MLNAVKPPAADLAAKAAEATALLKALANEHRLLILCHLIADGEIAAGDLVRRVGLSQSALSQHLAKLRAEGLIAFRRDSQTLYYRVADPRAAQLVALLRDIFCPELEPGSAPAIGTVPYRKEAGDGGHSRPAGS
ncbi:MAG: ArsR/SmtB family transcription factor [Allosphingosinicella sp.]